MYITQGTEIVYLFGPSMTCLVSLSLVYLRRLDVDVDGFRETAGGAWQAEAHSKETTISQAQGSVP